jgi:hypothetical protein
LVWAYSSIREEWHTRSAEALPSTVVLA